MQSENILLSILVPSKNKNNLNEFFNSFENNAASPSSFEVIVNIDENDLDMKNFLEQQILKRKFFLKYIESQPGYFNGHIHNNTAQELSNKDAYFITCLTDRMQISTKDWDHKLSKYKNFFKDDIFRLTCSEFKSRNYIDYWESCFAPSNIVFTTRKWIEICNYQWSPVFSADSFQQSISYYMMTYNNFSSYHFKRDVSLNEFLFDGQKPEPKSEIDEYERLHGQLKAWDILVSPNIQQVAKRIAMKLIINILKSEYDDISYVQNKSSYVLYRDGKAFLKLKFEVSSFKYHFLNFFRKFYYLNYSGSGFGLKSYSLLFNICWYLNFRFRCLRGIKDFYNKYFANILG